ncbi:uncharacterized protein PAN0_006c2852 [Moesziomyces antarcticus]|uniref:Related to NUM1 - nuclear migration protein n=2 Tax=Pseudozyma antarctica TaxID=84753 RepID=A0A5C3FN13_PSEA2|nr:uncharacterized protein PAN0_006c2852 [Moesziomyces antarcticus]GAK64638.1 conserved hypothetical protein [Moesziomyces antarcticus]SPO45620.1 related to NUM1 - nuclear migration protein [Moesziomyces antarcticus]
MDPSGPDTSSEGLFEGNLPPSPSPASRHVYPASPKDVTASSNLAFRPPPRPGSSLRKGRKSDFNTPAPPPLPTAPMPIQPFADATNFGSHSSPSRSLARSTSAAGMSRNDSENGATIDLTRLVRERLQTLREENESQVNSAGLLGQGLLELRTKIESMMDELAEELSAAEDHSEDSHGAKAGNARIRDLSERIDAEIQELERQKHKLFSDITVHSIDMANGDVAQHSMHNLAETPSKATRVADAIRNLTATPAKSPAAPQTGSTPRQADRRTRNAAARQAKADTDLINEIQAGLVQEVRRLQGLLKERDDQRVSLERSHTELEKQLDQYKPRVIQMTETEDALKQENWDLNVAKQNLEEQLSDIKSSMKKAELDNVRLSKEVSKARETVDAQRLQIDAHVAELERLNKARETEVALARRERAGMQRDVSDLQSELQKFRTQQLNDRGGVSRSVSNSFMSDITHDDANGDADALAARLRAASGEAPRSPGDSIYSADGAVLSPLGNRLGRDKETQDLRAKLALAQRKAGKDAAEKRRVREKNAELTKLLVKAGVKVPQGLDDDAETSEDEELQWLDENDAHSPSAKRLSHLRAGRSAASLKPRLGRKMGLVSSTSTDSIIEYAEYEDDSHIGSPAGPEDASPSRASLEGMDPAFADLGRADAANTSIDSMEPVRGHRSRLSIGSSPLARNAMLPHESDGQDSPSQQRALPKGGRRSGATVRATSSVYEPTALGNELGGLAAELEQAQMRDTADIDVQTDDLPDHVALALARRDQEHSTVLESLRTEHASKLSSLQDEHTQALDQLKQTHDKAVGELTAAHEKALADKDQEHSAAMEAALAERSTTHEAALAEARSRHSRALAEQVAASSAALAAAVASHKTSTEDFERKVREEKELKEASHTFALTQKDRAHKDAVNELQTTHAGVLERLREEHRQLVAIREKSLQEVDAQLAEQKQAHTDLAASHEAAVAALHATHRDTLDAREAELESIKKSLAQRDQELGAAKQEIVELQNSIAALQAETAELKKQLAEWQQKHTSAEKELGAAKQEIVELQNNTTALKAETTELKTQLNEWQQKHTAAEKELGTAKQEIVTLQNTTTALKAETADINKQLTEWQQKHTAAEKELGTAKQEALELQTSITGLKAETAELKKQLVEWQQKHTAAERELSEAKSNLDVVSDKVRRHEETALELARQREAEATAAAAAVVARSEALTATEAQKEQLEAAHAVAIAQKERVHQDAVKQLEDQHAKTVAQIRAEHKQTLEGRDQTLQTHQQLVADRERALEEQRSDAQKAQAQVQSLQQLVAESERALEQQRSDGQKAQAQVDSLQQLVAERERALEQQNGDAQKAQAKVESLEQLVADRERALEEQRGVVQKSQAELQSLQQLVAERERALEEQRGEMQKAQAQVVTHEQLIATLQAEASSVHQNRSTTEAKLKETETAHSTLQKQHDEAKASVAALQSKVRYLESSIAAQRSSTEQNRLASDKELQMAQSALNTAQKKVREQEASLTKAEAAAAAAFAAVAKVETQLKTTEAQLHAAESELEELRAKNEAAVTDTENEADDFKDAVEANDAPAAKAVEATMPAKEVKDSSCQTDDAAWLRFQEAQQRKVVPTTTSSATQTSAPSSPLQPTDESLAAQNNLVILGGLKSVNRQRDSVGTFGGERASSPATMVYSPDALSTHNQSRRPSADSTWSRHDRNACDIPPVPPLPDKTKVPLMSMPPPPSMPPPSLKRAVAPPRPTSPPPADLLTRAQQRHLQVPAGSGEQPRSVSRASGRSGPPPSAYPGASRVRQQSSGTGSVRSRTYSGETSASMHAQPLDGSIYNTLASGRKSIGSRKSAARRPAAGPRQSSAASFVSDVTSEVSRRLSMMSSRASEADAGDETFVVRGQNGAGKMHGQRGLSEFGAADSTDPAIIHAITQTMIGEYMFKYTRKSMGRGGHSDKRHRRYFWLHPYTKMLYWTISDPGGAKVSEGTSKSASIESVRVVEDSNPSPPGLHPESIIITTASREVKITAPNRERHEAWLAALEYLVHRPTMQDATVIASNAAPELMSDAENDPTVLTRSVGRRAKPRASAATLGSASVNGKRRLSAQRSFLSRRSSEQVLRTESTPRRRGSSIGGQSVLYPSMGKRRDVAAKEWLEQHEHERELGVSMSPSQSLRRGVYSASVRSGEVGEESYDLLDLTATQSPLRGGLASDDARLKTAEEMLEEDEPEEWDGLTNVRACCDGKHDVGSLAHDHSHHPGGSSSRKSSRLHQRESSGGSRFASLGLKSKLDAAVRAAEEREQQQQQQQQVPPVPRLPVSLLPNVAGLGRVMAERESMESAASVSMPTNAAGDKLRVAETSFASVFGGGSVDGNARTAAGTGGSGTGGPSYGERISQIRKARQSGGEHA